MYAFGRGGVHAAHEVLVHLLGHEGHEGSDHLGQRDQHRVEGDERGFLGIVHALAPEALAAAAHIPVAQIVHKLGDGAGGFGDAVVAQVVVYALDQLIEAGQHPLVHQGQLDVFDGMILGVEVVNVGVEHEESVGILQRAHELALALGHGLRAETAGQPRRARGVEIPAHGVGTLLVQHAPGIDHIALVLGHLLAVLVLHVTQHDAVFKRRTVKHQSRDGHEGVEPPAGLVDGFGDEVGREALFKNLLVFKGIVPLGKGHGAAVVPAVDDFLDAVHGLAALGAGDFDLVHIGAVQLDIAHGRGGHLAQLLTGADHVDVPLLADPDGQRRAPVTLARQTPVHHVFQEVAHAAFLDVVGHPVDGAVVFHQLVAHGGHADEPRGTRVIEQRRVAAPAEGIVMRKGQSGQEQPAPAQVLDDLFVDLLGALARPRRAFHELALRIHQLYEGKLVVTAHARVVLAERRGDVHDAGAVGQRDIVVADHIPALFAGIGDALEAVERLVGRAAKLGALHGFEHLALMRLFAKDGVQQRLRQDVGLPIQLELAVVLMRVDAQGHVGGKRPGRGGPGEDIGILTAYDLEANRGRNVADLLVALRDLVAGERGAAAGAVGHDLEALVEQAFFPDLLQAPPLGLDIVVLVGDVGVLHIRPEAHTIGHFLPLVLILPHALFALGDEGLDAVGLDLWLAVQAQQLFHLQLHGQAVRIPAGLAQDVLALHALEARNQVLDGARFDVADVRAAVGRGRAVEKGETLRAVAVMEAFFHDAFALPEVQHFLFALDEVHVRGYFAVHWVRASFGMCGGNIRGMKKPPRATGRKNAFPRYHPF